MEMKHKKILIATSRLRSSWVRRQMSWITAGARSSRSRIPGNFMPEVFAVDRFTNSGSKLSRDQWVRKPRVKSCLGINGFTNQGDIKYDFLIVYS